MHVYHGSTAFYTAGREVLIIDQRTGQAIEIPFADLQTFVTARPMGWWDRSVHLLGAMIAATIFANPKKD